LLGRQRNDPSARLLPHRQAAEKEQRCHQSKATTVVTHGVEPLPVVLDYVRTVRFYLRTRLSVP
jgi:hypothetical protein